MSRAVAVAAVLAVGCLVGTARAEKFTVDTGEFFVNCTSTGQLCAPPMTLEIGDAANKVKIRKIVYDASSAHCSAGRLHVALDGVEIGKMRFVIGKERSTLRRHRTLPPGTHTLAFQFEGRPGGCNTGSVSSWGGLITVTARR